MKICTNNLSESSHCACFLSCLQTDKEMSNIIVYFQFKSTQTSNAQLSWCHTHVHTKVTRTLIRSLFQFKKAKKLEERHLCKDQRQPGKLSNRGSISSRRRGLFGYLGSSGMLRSDGWLFATVVSFKTERTSCTETSVTNYLLTLRKIPEAKTTTALRQEPKI